MRRYATARTGIRVEARMRELLYQAYLRYPRAFYDRHATGQVVSRATNDLYPIRYFIGWGLTQGAQSLMMIVGISVVLFLVNAKLAAIAICAMPLVGILTFSFARKVMPISRRVQQLRADVTEAADEAVVGIEMVQAFGREDDVQARFAEKAGAVRDGVLHQARVEAAFLPGLLFLPTLSIAAVVLFGGHDVIGGALTYGEFFLFYQLLLQMVWPLEALGWILSLAQRATASASRSFAWLDGNRDDSRGRRAAVAAGRSARRRLRRASTSRTAPAARCSRASTCAWRRARSSPSAARRAPARPRSSTSCRASTTRPRERCGSAASTSETCRSRSCGGRSRSSRSARSSSRSPLRDNVTAARPDAPWDEVLAACDAAGVSQFADELPDGFDTLIGERGVNLSGGQRQRVALARALVAGARVIVLDDPMSAVDTQTERHLVTGLRPALAGRTVLIAAQRLSTVQVADRAVVLDDGVILEDGRGGRAARRGRAVRGALRRGSRCRIKPIPASPGSAATCRAGVAASPRCRSSASSRLQPR